MPLNLRAVSLNDQPITQPIAASFGAQGGSVGRADTNTLALPDPERRISRRQADISVVGTGFVIKNVGSANPIIVCDQSLALGESAPLRHGDQVRIGGYLLVVTSDAGAGDDRTHVDSGAALADPFAALVSPAVAPKPTARPPAFPPSSPFADLGSPVSAGNPFAELLGEPARAPAPFALAPPSSPVPNRLPDDFDPFATPATPAPAAPPHASTSNAGGAFEDLIPSAAPASIDAMFGLSPGGTRDPLADFLAGAPIAAVGERGSPTSSLSTDPLALFRSETGAPARAPVSESAPDQTPELRGAFVPPRPQMSTPEQSPSPAAAEAPSPLRQAIAPPTARAAAMPHAPLMTSPAPRPVATPAGPAHGAGDETTEPPVACWSPDALAVWNALCEGAGVRLDPPPNTGPAFMRVVGMMLRASVEGTVQLMAMRQATRQELQAQVTVIRPKNNNPLKFAPDGQSALEQILQPAVRGFLPGPAAMTDAMNDLLGHAIGTMAGTRAALEGVLKRFGPQELEAKLVDKSVLDSVLPMNRKAKLWELYLQHYESIRDEAQEDFHTLFGRAFLAAYEQQLERLRREKSAAPK
jgi:FHA domain-containing protein